MKLQDLFEYLKENLYTHVADALKIKYFLLKEDDDLLIQLPYSNNFVFRFYYYLQLRIFVSYGHLIPNLDINSILQSVGEWSSSPVDLPAKNLCDILNGEMDLKDNLLFLGLKYLACDGRAAWQISLEDNKVTIKDWINGWDDGSVLENYLSDYDEIADWQKNVIDHFGGYIDKNHICLDYEIDTPDDFIKAIIIYLHMSVLVSSGHRYIGE